MEEANILRLVDNSDFSDSFDDADLLEQADLIESQFNQQRPQIQDYRIREEQTAGIDSTIDYGEDFNSPIIIDDDAMEQLDRIENNSYNNPASSQGLVQQRLWGAPPPPASRPPPRPVMVQKEHSGAKKQWDYKAMSKSNKQRKQKARAEEDGDMIIEDDLIEFEQFPSLSTAVKSWIYPTNYPIRDYQINITTQCLFQNTLVALPTGLGKTLIAGVVIMNYYKWFPTAKVVFLAPTKPLVDQQAKACHDVCGIPQSDVSVLYGDVSQQKREAIIREKRVLYMTPQTLNNDLQKGVCDPQDVVLIVIDEAHKGQGDYSYCSVVRHMMKTNPHFRVLALTATPGNTPEQVQPIIDNLHISNIAIRNDSSPDIKQYTHKKIFEEHIIKMDYFIDELCMQWEDVVKRTVDPLIAKDLLPEYTINKLRKLHPYSITALRSRILPHQKYLFGSLNKAGDATRAMRNLQIQSIEIFYQNLQELSGKKQDPDTKKTIEKLMLSIESERSRRNGRLSHPKMEKVESLLLDHFTNFSTEKTETRAIVFASLRETVDEVVEQINTHSPILRAAAFVGQAASNGKKGLNQKQQQKVMNEYKDGTFNVLVSTSIGEEGLDIGDIDLTITYDPGRSSISMLQKIGRTGRKRQGHVHTLMAEDLEDKNWDEAQARHQDVQAYIVSGDQVALYNDVERLIPHDVEPECEKRHVQVEEWESLTKKNIKKDSSSSNIRNFTKASKPKRKRNENPLRNVPEQATSGFVNASDLVEKKTDTAAMNVESDSEDEALKKGIDDFQSQKEVQPLKLEPSGPSSKRNEKLKNKPSQLQRQPSHAVRRQASQASKSNQSVAALSKTLSLRTHSITLHDDEEEVESPKPTQSTKRQRTRSPTPMSPTSSPVLVLNKPPILKSPSEPPFGSKKRSKKGFKAPRLLFQDSPVIDLDSDQVDSPVVVPGKNDNAKRKDETFKTPARPLGGKNANNSCMSVDSSPLVVNNTRMNVQENTYIKPFHYEPKSILSNGSPDQSQVVRKPGQSLIAPRTTGKSLISSSPRGTPYHPFKRLRQRSSSNTSPMPPQPTTKRSRTMMTHGEYLDLDAQVSENEDASGDERSSDVEALSESDIDFVAGDQSQLINNDIDYNQQAAYVMGLATQVPNGGGPQFNAGPIRNPVGFMLGSKEAAHRPMLLSSSPNVADPDDTYDYEDGFVVDDDQL
ncbi:ATP-dependent DNA helicase MPH1 [Wallemia ichthyophaga EXF-994]|uniref:ATP-dependent DNA helicase n=1 Tax=Wallemia ichthyophaga (strain EXF-994 / CBS 113033) TaxID=1299270 RepID=R9AKV0_WALI9|nr:ATP-dependent DNA helicase MPH1 [Wallemia ichthyophaga EXF-994]EOR02812.1 ATP-dependent DNA helicase MPH1 [Wallemia ichthyophaga EXF-994]